MVQEIIYILIGFVLLILGADVLVRGSSNIAKKFNIPEIIIGLTIVCLGTSLPELIITISSASKGYSDLIIGNAIGSNLCNILMILGLVSMIRPMLIEKDVRRIHIPISFFVTVLVLLLGNGIIGNSAATINSFEGLILLIAFIAYFSYPIIIAIKDIIKTEEKEKKRKKKPKKEISIFTSLLLILAGVFFLKFGGDFVVDNCVLIAQQFNISERIIGLTVVAIGTALPELVTSIIATITKDTDIAIGNLIGSSILNLCLILGVGAMISPLPFTSEINSIFILSALSLLLLWVFSYIGKEKKTVSRIEGAIMFCIYIAYIIKLIV